jgi:hypothetical protein
MFDMPLCMLTRNIYHTGAALPLDITVNGFIPTAMEIEEPW